MKPITFEDLKPFQRVKINYPLDGYDEYGIVVESDVEGKFIVLEGNLYSAVRDFYPVDADSAHIVEVYEPPKYHGYYFDFSKRGKLLWSCDDSQKPEQSKDFYEAELVRIVGELKALKEEIELKLNKGN